MSEQRVCDMCLQPHVGADDRSSCTRECPSRRGQQSEQVMDELVRGRIVEGVHRRSPLLIEAQQRLMVLTEQNAAAIDALYDRVSVLERSIQTLELRRHEYRNILIRIAYYNGGGYDILQRSASTQSASEPARHVNE